MASLNIIRPPKVKIDGKGKGFWSQIGMIIIGTTISLVFTIVAAQLLESHQRAKDRRLSALMVMASIERFANDQLDGLKKLETSDSICAWLLSVPPEELELLPEIELGRLMNSRDLEKHGKLPVYQQCGDLLRLYAEHSRRMEPMV